MSDPFELMVAPTGARLQKTDHPAVPISADEIADTALACAEAGATAIHLHVRDAGSCHTLDPIRYTTVIQQIATKTDISVQISTESAGTFDISAQHDCLARVPATDASIALRELARHPDGIATYAMAAARGISIQHILYSSDEVSELLRLFETGEVPQQSRRAIFVLGRYAANQQSAPQDLTPFLRQLGEDALNWAVCAFGRREQECLLASLDRGGNARIGFENNRAAPDGTQFPDNATSVASFIAAATSAGFHPKRTPR